MAGRSPRGAGADVEIELNNRQHSDDDDLLVFSSTRQSLYSERKSKLAVRSCLYTLFIAFQLGIVTLAVAAIVLASSHRQSGEKHAVSEGASVSKLAFGSCTERGIGTGLDAIWTEVRTLGLSTLHVSLICTVGGF